MECQGQEKVGKWGSWLKKHDIQCTFDNRFRRLGYCHVQPREVGIRIWA